MLVGREEERARIDALLEAGRRGRTRTLVVAGEPGIGKTALLEDAVGRASGMRTLRLTGAEAESTLPFAGLHALLLPLVESFSQLEPPQEKALRIALALEEGDEPDVLAVNAGTLTVLADASSTQPLLLAIDDAHWLDGPSGDALTFALRRLEAEDIACLVAVRTADTSAFDDGFDRLELAPLPASEAREILARRSEAVPASSVDRMLELAAGNPLALLELPAALAGAEVDGAVTAPERIKRAFAVRLDALPDEARRALVLAAAEPDTRAVRAAAEQLGLGREALEPAEAAGLVRLELDGIAFRHPLVRSLAYATTDPISRREGHAALADALIDEADRDRRAWHLAAAATEPDEELAMLLEQTADRAEARGGHAAAARALERAARLSRDDDAAARRLTRSARLAFWAGDAEHALALADEALEATADPDLRADAVLERSSIRGAQWAGYAGLVELAQLEQLDPARATRALVSLVSERSAAFDAARAAELSARIEAIAPRAGPWWRPRGLMVAAAAYLAVARLEDFDRLLAEVIEDDAVAANHALDLIWAERYDLARSVLDSTLREGRSSGNQMRVIWNQACIANLELRLGRLHQALPAVAEAVTLGDARGVRNWAGIARLALAGVHAWRGEADACRTAAAQSIATASEAHSVSDELQVHAVLGRLALSLGRHEDAVEELIPAEAIWTSSTHVEPSAVAFMPDLVEAHLHLGNVAEARESLARFREAAERARRQWALAAVARCEGLLASADAYAEHFERALDLLESSPLALERARTQLAFGERLRRAGQRRAARLQLRAAHDTFSAVDAAPWADRAAAELRATGESVGPRTPDRRAQLSPQERQIAQLVGEGKTNKEIAAQLYLSPKTIEYHLGNAYRKLDIHSRAELTRIVLEH